MSKQSSLPQLTFAKEIADIRKDKAKEKNEEVNEAEDTKKGKGNEIQKPVPMKRSISKDTRLAGSPDSESSVGENKPSPKEKPKAGGWMKLLRKMSTNESPSEIQPMAPELSDDNLEMPPEENPRKQKQVAAVRLPSAVPGEAWMGVVAEFKGRSVDDDDVETMKF